MMKPTIVKSEPIILLGFGFFGDPFALSGVWTEENEIGRLWARFMSYLGKNGARIKHTKSHAHYEVHIGHEETSSRGHYEIFVGVQVEKLEDVPIELLVKIIPATRYAVFTLQGEQIVSDWNMLVQSEWLPGTGYQAVPGYGFLVYDQRFKGLDKLSESQVDAFVPVTRVDDVSSNSHQ